MNTRDFSVLQEERFQRENDGKEEAWVGETPGEDSTDMVLAESDVQLLTTISDRLEQAQRSAQDLVIDSEEKAKEATASLALVRKSRKRLEKRRLELTRPLDEQKRLKALPFRNLEDPLKTLDKELEPKISHYHDQVEKRRKALAEEQRQVELAALKAKEKEQLEQAEINESALALEDAVNTREQIMEIEAEPQPVDSRVATRTVVGTAHRRRPWDYKVVDLKKVPRRLLATLDEKGHLVSGHSLVMAALKTGEREITGIEIYQRSNVSIR